MKYLGTIETRKNPVAVVRLMRKLRTVKDLLFVILESHTGTS